ncbi:MAG: hypothetical protein Q8R57_06945, partial [Bacteroidota bacterium]|nr:hypothetical protein [Bacteroidota bacterium]
VYYFAETELGLFTGADIFKEGSWLYPGAEVPAKTMQKGEVLIFDSLLMQEERNIPLSQIRQDSTLREDTHFALVNNQKKNTFYYLFVKQ